MTRELFANPLADPARSPWLDAAERAGDELRQSIVEIEAEGAVPREALDLLRRHDLLNLVIPVELGGAGESWTTAAEVSRVIARTDAGLAHALGYHYTWVWFVVLYDTENGREIIRRTARDQLFWASIGSAFGGSGSIRADGTGDGDGTGTRTSTGAEGPGYIVDAKRGFATGSPLADLFFTQTVSADDGRLYLTAVDTTLPGVSVADDWDAVGQRLSASNAIVLDAVRVGARDLIAILPPPGTPPAPLQSLMIPSFQLLFGYLNVGIAEGALLEARDYVLEHGRPWVHAHEGVTRSADDPHVRSVFGEHAAHVVGSAAQVREAARALQALFDGAVAITPETRGQTAELIAAAKVVSHRVGLDATTAIFDATGARSSARRFGLDRFWRNLRTVTLHDPVAYKFTELGDYILNGALPEPSVYR